MSYDTLLVLQGVRIRSIWSIVYLLPITIAKFRLDFRDIVSLKVTDCIPLSNSIIDPSALCATSMKYRIRSLVSLVIFLLLAAQSVTSVAHAKSETWYRVISMSDREAVIEITPDHKMSSVRQDSREFTRIDLDGSIVNAEIGAPQIPLLHLPFLLPTGSPMRLEVLESKLGELQPIDLAPMPMTVREGDRSISKYEIDGEKFANHRTPLVAKLEHVAKFRTAYAQTVQVAPVQFDAAAKTVQLLEKLVIRVRFTGSAKQTDARPLVRAESELFENRFVNGSYSEFYRGAQADAIARATVGGAPAFKRTPQHSREEKWVSIETNKDGIYRITAEELLAAGVGEHPDPATFEMFGYGARMMPEDVTDSSGEWRQVAIDVRTQNGEASEIYFYATGPNHWKYQHSTDPINGLYHTTNPYSTTGRYLLKVGGDRIANGDLSVVRRADTILTAPRESATVFSAFLHEAELAFEVHGFSREFVGERIPREGLAPLNIAFPQLPGYTSDSTLLRVGFNSAAMEAHQVSVRVNGKHVVDLAGEPKGTQESPGTRSWSDINVLGSTFGTPGNIELQFLSDEPESKAWLNWIELFYRRSTNVESGQIPFFIFDKPEAFRYNFTNTSGGAVWDVTSDERPVAVKEDNGGSISVELQGRDRAMRRFIAFSRETAHRIDGKMSLTSAPTLHLGLAQVGATNIIITPAAFSQQANELKELREQGGQATEGIQSVVVHVEDIYKEFGYGVEDPAAIRDFMSYMYRQTIKNGTTVPLFLTLFGSGHVDYQNRVTELPLRLPIWHVPHSESVGSMRHYVSKNDPDDGWFACLVPKTVYATYRDPDVGVGRLPAQSEDDANALVAKLRKYELSSDIGNWRSVVTSVIDDRFVSEGRDPLTHLDDSEIMLSRLPSRVQLNKVYGVNYPTLSTAAGRRKPEMERALFDAFNEGSVILSFIGHGNPKVWTHEDILKVPSTINKLNNFDRLTFVSMATCDFAEFDGFFEQSGGVMMMTRPNGGAVSMLGTSRSVYENEALYPAFFEALFDVPCESAYGTTNLGTALMVSKQGRTYTNASYFYLLGDPALRLLVPKEYVAIDSINGKPAAGISTIPALSNVTISGRVSPTCDSIYGIDTRFNGKATVTLYDTRTEVIRRSQFSSTYFEDDKFKIEGPILYRGTATVTNGRFTSSFMVPRDIKFDTNFARISVIAFADDNRSALGDHQNIKLAAADPDLVLDDTSGPELTVYIGSRRFKSGDIVPTNSTIIVDVKDLLGLNTSTASIGHSFVAWVDDETERTVDLAGNYASQQDDFTSGSTTQHMTLPEGRHVLNVRAFDALNNPTFAQVEFFAKGSDQMKVYNATNSPNPVRDHTTFSFMHPADAGTLVDVDVEIYSITGQMVRRLRETDVSANVIEIPWNTLDESGNPVAQAAYTYRISVLDKSSGETAVAFGRFVLVK